MGTHILAIKDMAGLCKPYAAHAAGEGAARGSRRADPLPHARHQRRSTPAAILRAADAGVDIADAALASMSGHDQPAEPQLARRGAANTPRDTGLDLEALQSS